MQDADGTHSCNDPTAGGVQSPCPDEQIYGMVGDGVRGTEGGVSSTTQSLNLAVQRSGGLLGRKLGPEEAQTYYWAAKLYNAGPEGDLAVMERSASTACYVSDVANRLVGWVEVGGRGDTCSFTSGGGWGTWDEWS